jgi:DNA repair protein RadC
MKDQFLKNGLDVFEAHQVLEMLLFYSVPRKDTNPLAHRLLDRFGGLSEVLDADYEQLTSVEGVSEHTAILLHFCRQLVRRYHREKVQENTVFNNLTEMGRYLQAQYVGETVEKLRIMCLNNRGKLLNCSIISEGTVTATSVDVRLIVQTVLRYPTTAVIMAHNHPAGFALPSNEDYQSTILVRQALDMLGIQLVDHMIFALDDYVSMRQTPRFAGAFSPYARDNSAPDWLQ